MAKKKDELIRVDPVMAQTLRELARWRVHRGLAKMNKEEISTREMSRLLTKTLGFKQSVEEMKTKPKKEDLK